MSPRYIHINPVTNQIHLLVPVVGGQEISTDNTCKASVSLKKFFDGEALHELTAYKNALAFDIALLEEGNSQRVGKEARLAQIEAYIEAVSAMQYSYGDAMIAFLTKPSNLYAIQLRPLKQDSQSKVVNPAFNIERRNNARGTPLSPLYNAMHSIFPDVVIAVPDPQSVLTIAVLGALPSSPKFEDIVHALTAQCKKLFGMDIDFTCYFKRAKDVVIKQIVNQAHIDALMVFGEESPATPQDYIDALLETCAADMWRFIPASPFYSIQAAVSVEERTEHLSILTQFFLANLNVYCQAKGISTKNFGVILDASNAFSNELVSVVSTALSGGDEVERELCTFCNVNADKFELSRSLNAEEIAAVKQKFERTYHTVTATKENPHMDDFMILDKEAIGETAKLVTHQGSICVNFAEIVDAVAASANAGYFASIRGDFSTHPAEIPHKNESVACELEVDIEALLARINGEQFEKLPAATKDECRAHLSFQVRCFLQDVAKGKQDEAKALLTAIPANTQTLLKTPGIFTDYSGRTFNCTAYEYAYWAKDTHMCRMLESHMDEETKALILARIDTMESIGLDYQQQGESYHSKHFDLTPLKQALQQYVDCSGRNWDVLMAAWIVVGKAQRDVPAHIAQEYCRPDRSFFPMPRFNEVELPRVLTFYNWTTSCTDSWFPLPSSNAGLGFDFALTRAAMAVGRPGRSVPARRDLVAVSHLDEVRTADLTLSRDHLKPLGMPERYQCFLNLMAVGTSP